MELTDPELPQPNPQVHCPLLSPRTTGHLSALSHTPHPKLNPTRKLHTHWPWFLSMLTSLTAYPAEAQGSEPQRCCRHPCLPGPTVSEP